MAAVAGRRLLLVGASVAVAVMAAHRGGARWATLAAIRFYRAHLSVGYSRQCMYRPTCSTYALKVVELHGFREGVVLIAERLLRCNVEERRKFHADHSCSGCDRRKSDPVRRRGPVPAA
jgi:putative membrane protein insertion efficiency factor